MRSDFQWLKCSVLVRLGCWIRFYRALNLTNHVLIPTLQSCCSTCVMSFTVWLALPRLISCLFTSCCCAAVCIHLAKVTAVCSAAEEEFGCLHPVLNYVALLFPQQDVISFSLIIDFVFPLSPPPKVSQISVQPPVNGELILRFQQLQSRLATLKIENEEVKRRNKFYSIYRCVWRVGGLEMSDMSKLFSAAPILSKNFVMLVFVGCKMLTVKATEES